MAWMESIAQKLERERKLREQFPEFEVAPSPDRVMQVDNHNMQNGGSITRFSQAVMQVARHVSELANESGSAPMDVQFTADRLSAGIPGYQTDNYTATPQKRAGVPLGVAEAFPEEAAGRRTYGTPGSTGESGQLWNTPVAEYATNLPVVGGGVQHALNTPYVGDAIAEATRPRTWAEMAVLAPVASGLEAAGIGGRIAAGLLTPLGADAGIAANVAGNVGMNLGAHVGADVAGSLTDNAPAPVQMGAQVLGGLVGGGAGLGAVSALSRPETIANAAKLATGYRDLTKGIPVGASIKDIGDELNALDEQVKAEGGWTAQTIAKYQELTGRRPTASMTRPAESIGPPNTSPEGIRQGAGNAIVKGQGAANINLPEQIPLLKVYSALDEAKALLPERAANVSALRRQQAAAYESVAQRVRDGKLSPQEGARMALGAMHGSAEMPTFTPLRESLDEKSIDATLKSIVESDVSPFTRSGAQSAFYKLLDGYPPTPSELKAWGDVFGPDQMEPIQSSLRKLGVAPSTSIGEHLLDIANAPRSLVASVDFSGYLRQGAVLGAGHPLTFAKDAPVYIKAFASEQYARGVDDAIRAAPFAQELQDFGLYIAPWKGGQLSNREEAFMSRLVGKLPLVEQSQRGYVTFLNKLRSDVGNSVMAGWDDSQRTPQNIERLTSFLNAATGRGDLKALNDSGPLLNAMFFSPRFFASRVQMAGQAAGAIGSLGKSAATLSSFDPVSKEIAKDTLAFVGTGIGILTLLKKSGVAEVQLDPRSSDFGKAKIGNTRYDFWAGYQQIARFTAQLITNEAKSTGSGNIYGLNRAETVGKFLQSKLAPAPGLAVDLLRGETPLGDELTPSAGTLKTQAWNRLVPLFVQDLTDAIKSDGATGVLKGLPSGFGVGTQTYESPSAALYDRMDGLASELKRVDEQGKPITRFNDLPQSDQAAILAAHPDLAQQRSDQRIAQGGDKATLEQMRLDARQHQEEDNARVQAHDMTWKQWKDNRTRRLNELQGASQVVYGTEPIANPKNAYERWLNTVRENVTNDGVNWDAVDEWVSRQPESDQKYIADNTGSYNTPFEKDRRAVADKLDSSGYFDIRDRVWQRVAAQDDTASGYKTMQDFENAVAKRFRSQLADRGVTGVAAEIMVSDLIEKLPQIKMWSKVSNDIEEMWIKANPQLASDAIRYGYLDPSSLRTAEKSVLVGGAQ